MHADARGEMTPTERVVAQIWENELGTTEVRPESDFFQLGGDSLLLLNMLFQVGQHFGVEIQPAALFEDSSLRGFCRAVDVTTRDSRLAADSSIEGSI